MIRADFATVSPAAADLKKLNAEFKAGHKGSVAHTLAALRVDRLLGADKAAYEKEAAAVLNLAQEPSLQDGVAVLETLRDWGSAETEAFKKAAHAKWPEATVFS